jgi:hypothetical protein
MIVTRNDIKLIAFFLLFVGFGLLGSFYFDIREDKKALSLSMRWCFFPSLLLGCIYAYYGGFKRAPPQALWRKVISVLVLTVVATLIFLRCFQGYIWIINSQMGNQSQVLVSGVITKVDRPVRKKRLNSYIIHVKDTLREVVLDVPGEDWREGQYFKKLLTKGSLELLYGK